MEAKIRLANCLYLQENYQAAIHYYKEISDIDINEEIEYNLANSYYM